MSVQPTNHLDSDTVRALADALETFEVRTTTLLLFVNCSIFLYTISVPVMDLLSLFSFLFYTDACVCVGTMCFTCVRKHHPNINAAGMPYHIILLRILLHVRL